MSDLDLNAIRAWMQEEIAWLRDGSLPCLYEIERWGSALALVSRLKAAEAERDTLEASNGGLVRQVTRLTAERDRLSALVGQAREALLFYAAMPNWRDRPADRNLPIEIAQAGIHFQARSGKALPAVLADIGDKAVAALAAIRETDDAK